MNLSIMIVKLYGKYCYNTYSNIIINVIMIARYCFSCDNLILALIFVLKCLFSKPLWKRHHYQYHYRRDQFLQRAVQLQMK